MYEDTFETVELKVKVLGADGDIQVSLMYFWFLLFSSFLWSD